MKLWQKVFCLSNTFSPMEASQGVGGGELRTEPQWG